MPARRIYSANDYAMLRFHLSTASRLTTMSEFLPFARPSISQEEIDEVCDTLKSGWLTTGAKTKQFEADFAKYFGVAHALAVNSATAGLHLALEAIGIQPGDEVITTTYTFTATAEVIRYLGAHPVFVDIDPATFNVDPALIEARITNKTRAIIPVHFAGLSCDMDAIFRIAERHKLKVVEDAAHALPSTYRNQLIGSLKSDVVVFSFYANKTITTGEGGMVVCHDDAIAERCKVMRLHGINRDAFDRYRSNKPSWYYEVVAPGFKYNMTDIAASIGIHQLKKAEAFRQRRQQIAEYYSGEFRDVPLTLPQHGDASHQHAWHLYPIRLNDDCRVERDDFIQRMADQGIGCSVHFIPLHIHPYWRDTYNLKADDYPKAYHAYRRMVSLPLFSAMSDAEAERVVAAVKSIVRG